MVCLFTASQANSTVVSSPPLPSHKPEHVCGWPPGWDVGVLIVGAFHWWPRPTPPPATPCSWRVSGYALIYWVKCRSRIVGDCTRVSFRRHQSIAAWRRHGYSEAADRSCLTWLRWSTGNKAHYCFNVNTVGSLSPLLSCHFTSSRHVCTPPLLSRA